MKYVVGYEGLYSVTEDGQIFSHKSNRFLKGDLSRSGYLRVRLSEDDRQSIHRIVANTYLEKVEGKDIINHKDGNKTNNHYTNLEWCTPSENMLHAVRTGLLKVASGEDCSYAKLDNKTVELIIKDLISAELSYEEMSEKYNISPTTISMINTGKRWSEEAINGSGKSLKGESNPNASITDEDVREVFELLKSGKSQSQVCKIKNLSKSLVSDIARRKAWTHVETDYVYSPRKNIISDEDKLELLREYSLGGITRKDIADKYGVSHSYVDKILSNKNK